jgi:N-acetyl-alpha-D-muramate 1-phosphate uridylyltransferase
MVELSASPQVVILAGGLGQRLRPLTEQLPKCLVPVAGRPFLAYVLDSLRECGIRRVLLCTGHLADAVHTAFGDGERFGLDISYIVEPRPLGTLGALRNADRWLDDGFVIRYGDSYLPERIDHFAQAARVREEPAAMAVLNNHDQWDRSNVVVVGDQVTSYGRRARGPDVTWIDYGMIAVEKHLLMDGRDAGHAGLFRQLAEAGQLAAIPVQQRFYEIGTPSSYREFCTVVQKGGLR